MEKVLQMMKAFVVIMCLGFITQSVQAQTNVYMHAGTQTVPNPNTGSLNFYDSGGPSSGDGSYYWEKWYQHNENATITFKNGDNPIKVTFGLFTAWDDDGTNAINLGQYSLRINNDHLYVYDGETASDDNLIVDLTGTIKESFSVMAKGPITFKFVSDQRYRDEGWAATVTSASTFEVQPPLIAKETCSDMIYLKSPAMGAMLYYTTNGNAPVVNDPLTGAILYEGPFSVNLDSDQPAVTVKAIAVVSDAPNSGVATHEFTHADQRPLPGVPTITIDGNIVTMTPSDVQPGLNDTYYVRYTTDGSDPSVTNGLVYSDPIEWHTPNTTFKAITQATDCPDKISGVVSATIGLITIPTPVITFDANGNATIECAFSQADIFYTTDGSTPDVNANLLYGGTFTVSPGTTVNAFANYTGDGYSPSAMASKVYVPSGGSGVSGDVVILDDREDHSWSYYSDGDQPVHSLKPADVKITYFGYGNNTMTTTDTNDTPTTFDGNVTADQVAVSATEAGNQFIYLKTLEAANEDGSGNYPYTTIANPFSKRPAYDGLTPTTRTIYFTCGRSNDSEAGTLNITYTGANGESQQTVVINNSNQFFEITARISSTITYTLSESTSGSNNRYVWFRAQYDSSDGSVFIEQQNCYRTNRPVSGESSTIAASSSLNYRGFYAWRVKRLSSGLTITDGTNNYGVGAIIDADKDIQFVTTKAEGNEVDFEALWAQAYVVTSNTATGLNANVSYERNFVVGAAPGTTALNVPVTYSSRYPDGTQATTNGMALGTFTLLADTKFEYMTLNGTGTTTANNHYLCFGRGITGGNNVQGINGTVNGNLNYTMRVESGTFGTLAYVSEVNCTVSGRVQVRAIMGCDYDRASHTNGLLSVSNSSNLFFTRDVTFSNESNKDQKVFDLVVKSGEYQKSYWTNSGDETGFTYTHSMYCGANFGTSSNNAHYPGVRYVTIEGGALGNVNGGRGTRADGNNNNPGATTPGTDAKKVSFNLRIKKDAVINGCVFGGAANTSAWGSKRIVVTGGEVLSWIAGGANGTNTTNGDSRTRGASYIYVGGNAKVGGSNAIRRNGTYGGQIFGAGRGNTNQAASMDSSYVVIADKAQILRKESEASGNVYGGGNIGYIAHQSNVYILGGTVEGSVFGGAYGNALVIPTSNVYVEGGTVNGSVYGGSNYSGTVTESHVTMTNGTTTNVYGAGLGSTTTTNVVGTTNVSISGGTISNNVYGGGQLGTVTSNTTINISGGTMNDVYGAGLGTEYTATAWPPTAANANVGGTTTVNVSGGTIANVYGGGENGSVAYSATATSATGKSTIAVSGGEITGDVFGGGQNGTTQGATVVNVKGGVVRGNVFGGAFGAHGRIYVTGMRTVNMTGGHVFGNVYGGSRNANDGNDLSRADNSFSAYTGNETICVTNISGGIMDQNVYAAGYYGNTFGSVYIFVGQNAINNAPYKQPTADYTYGLSTLNISGTVWAGGDWGTFSGEFGGSTISGNSNIYIDGTDYETETNQTSNAQYMNIGGSVLGCGTSCHAGKAERTIIIRNYGHADGTQPAEATRTLYSIQLAKVLIFDNSNLNFIGQGMVNSLNTTEKYSIYEIYNNAKTTNVDTDTDGVRIVNGSGLFLNAPVTQIANFRSMSCADVYASSTPTLEGYTVITPTTLPSCDNKVRVNNGVYVEIKYGDNFAALIGYSYMMASNNADDATCAYARPRWNYLTPIADEFNNPNDGGWISYTASQNTFALDGNAGSVQMPYENHTIAKNGEQYFRIWRVGGDEHYREGVFNAVANGTATFSTVDVTITLPAFRAKTNYYRFETVGEGANTNTTISYGADVLTFNAANYASPCADDNWMYYDETNLEQVTGVAEAGDNTAFQKALTEIKKKPDVNFGLVAVPADGLNGYNYIICNDADANLANANTIFGNEDNTEEPKITFRLTYYNKLSANMTWDPMSIVLVQCDENGVETDRVTISLAVSTSASIEQTFTTQVYAIMQGKGSSADTYSAKVVLPTFNFYTSGEDAEFTLNSVTYEPEVANGQNKGNLIARGGPYTYTDYAVDYAPSRNYDNISGWSSPTVVGTLEDTYPMTQANPQGQNVGYAGGRQEFAIDFTLHYNGLETAEQEEKIGTLTYNITFTNYKNADGTLVNNQPLTIVVEVWRRGTGNKFYLDGVNGSNSNSGKFPNDAVKSLSTIFNRCGFLAGDEVYVVNKVTANNALSWNGLNYDNVTLYRYNGGHTLKAETPAIVDNANNDCYKGELLVANKNVTITGITLDGYYNPSKGETPDASVTANAPLISIANGGSVELSTGAVLNKNNNTGNGGAVNIAEGGTLKMNDNAKIKNNLSTGDGAGVYMAGTMIVSDSVMVVDNKKGTAQNNVFLTAADKVIQIGTAASTDNYGALDEKARLGVTKQLYGDVDGYTKVVNVETDVAWLETPYNTHPNTIIYHDGNKYQLQKYDDPTFLYWIGTWVTVQDHVPTADEGGWPYDATTTSLDINTEYQLAWIISLVNGENGQTADDFSGKTVNINADIDMTESIWVPIGSLTHPFKGTFEGNGHIVEGMHSSLVQTNMAMFGNADGATIQNMVAKVAFDANSANMGTVVGTMKGTTTVNNVEAAGSIIGGSNTVNMGGLVGKVEAGTIHSSFAVNEMTGSTNTSMGGLVGTNGGNLYNSYANTTMTTSTHKGGLVGVNNAGCVVENCYVVLGQQELPAFAYTNNGSINYCYVDKAGTEVGDNTSTGTVSMSGTYAAVKDRNVYGYMYNDNIVTAAEGNSYAAHTAPEYLNKHTVVWNGLLSVLNQWVTANSAGGYTSWLRPTSKDINGDLPVLCFAKDNAMATIGTDTKYLQYSAYDLTEGTSFNNGIDGLLSAYSGQTANIFLYGNATEVENVPGANVNVFVNEDAVLMQKQGAKGDFINTTVGVTFDNSSKAAHDFWGTTLKYDWHLMSTPLSDASMGITYDATTNNWWDQEDDGQITGVSGSYLPDGSAAADFAHWDFYCYDEPNYHWINFKRSSANHYHYEEPHDAISYTNETSLTPGKGYMVAIDKDSYLSNTGTLNNGAVTIPLTKSGDAAADDTPQTSKDWGSNLVGNPYQAYLDLDAVTSGTGQSRFFVYDADNGTYGPYMTGSSVNPAIPSKYIHPHQGFFVVTADNDPNFKFTYAMATATKNETSYFRGEEQPRYPVVNLFASNESGNRDMAIIELDRPELDGVRKVNNLRNANFKLTAYYGGTDYALLFTPKDAERVPVHFATTEDGTYTMTWSNYNATFTSLFLVDNKTGARVNMLHNDHYTFDASADDYAARFFITFKYTDVDEYHTGDGEDFAYFDGSEWIINGQGMLQLVDVTGRVLKSEELYGEQNRVHFEGYAAGVYVLRLSKDNKAMNQKIVIR